MYIHTYIHRPLWASLGLSGPLWASLGVSRPLWASLGLSTYTHTYIHREDKTTHNRQLEPRPEVARQQDHTIADSWSPSVLRGPKLQDKKTRQYLPDSWSEARNCQTTKPDNVYPTAGTPASFECHFLIKLSSFRSHPRTVRTMNQISQISQISHVSRIGGNGRSRHLALALIVHASLPTF